MREKTQIESIQKKMWMIPLGTFTFFLYLI